MKLIRLPLLLCLAVFLALSCASAPDTNPPIEVAARVAGPLFFGSGISSPANIDVQITNKSAEVITVRTIRLSSPGMLEYGIRSAEKIVQQDLAAGETRVFNVPATAIASTTTQPTEPLTIRADLYLVSNGKPYHQFINIRGVQYN